MLAATTSSGLICFTSTSLKSTSTSSDYTHRFEVPCVPVRSHDDTTILLATANSIQSYNIASKETTQVYAAAEGNEISNAVGKDKRTLLVCESNLIRVVDIPTGQIERSLNGHESTTKHIALSPDGSVLASTATDGVLLHHLADWSQSALDGLGPLTASLFTEFHPHSRSKLLVGTGNQLFVYDTTKPTSPRKVTTSPRKVISLDGLSGDIVGLSSSPFSKTLVAVATADGYVGLIDILKDKPVVKSLSLSCSLTTCLFSNEGTSIFVGTTDGKLLVLDLRALDKPAKTIELDPEGACITALLVQKPNTLKVSSTPTLAAKTTSPTGSLTHRIATTTTVKSGTRLTSKPKISSPLTSKAMAGPSRTTPPTSALRTRTEALTSPSAARGISAATRATVKADVDSRPKRGTTPQSSPPRASETKPVRRTERHSSRTTGPTRATARSRTSLSPSTKPILSKPKSKASAVSPPVNRRPLAPKSSLSKVLTKASTSDVDDDDSDEPASPIVAARSNRIGALALGSPEVDSWLHEEDRPGHTAISKGKGRAIEFDDTDEEEPDQRGNHSEPEKENKKSWNPLPSTKEKHMQLSPMRPSMSHSSSMPPVPSPLRRSSINSQAGYDFLQSMIRDVMYDYQQETRAELRGLHLDLIRAGRGWKKELGVLMEEYVGDLKDLREENVRLREENERLRRGY